MANTKKEIKSLVAAQVITELAAARAELQSLRVKAAGSDLKNVRAIRAVRTTIARLATRGREVKSIPHS